MSERIKCELSAELVELLLRARVLSAEQLRCLDPASAAVLRRSVIKSCVPGNALVSAFDRASRYAKDMAITT